MRQNRLGKSLSEAAKEKLRNLTISKETREKISKAGIGRFFSAETRYKLSQIHKGKEFSEEHKRKLKIHRSTQILPLKDSEPELKIQSFLQKLGIAFSKHKYIRDIEHGYQCDIFIPSMNLVIECDGDYWHKYSIGREIDHIRTKELVERGFKVLRLWEREIRTMNLETFSNKLKSIEVVQRITGQ